jgi:signal transduction histidine kinase
LKEILLNLTLNAVQAISLEGEVRIESSSNGDGQLELSVTDNGTGIAADDREKVFEPFFTTKQRGTGLGLAIVARRVRELGGEIKLASYPSEALGTRFEVTLPVSSNGI